MHSAPQVPEFAYRSALGADRRADWALALVLLAMIGATLALYDAYAEGRWGGRPRTMAVPIAMASVAKAAEAADQPAATAAATSLVAAVQRANVAFAAARASGDPAPLQSAGAGQWLAQEQAYVAAMRGRGQTERWQLLGMDVLRQELRPDGTGFVCTLERWQVEVVAADGRVISSRGYTFTEGYTLVPAGQDWRVTQVDVAPA